IRRIDFSYGCCDLTERIDGDVASEIECKNEETINPTLGKRPKRGRHASSSAQAGSVALPVAASERFLVPLANLNRQVIHVRARPRGRTALFVGHASLPFLVGRC